MPLTVILAVGLDSSLLASQIPDWNSSGYFIKTAASIKEAIVHFRAGEFDLVLLGDSVPAESRERLAFLIRAFGSRIPVICVSNSDSDSDSFADATIRNEPVNLMLSIEELLAKGQGCPAPRG